MKNLWLLFAVCCASAVAQGANPPADSQGWHLQPDGCNYCSATSCTAMSCLPISGSKQDVPHVVPPPPSPSDCFDQATRKAGPCGPPHCVQVGDLITCDNVAQPAVREYVCINASHQQVECPPEPDRSWHVLVVTYGGTVSLVKDLTKREAEFISKRLLRLPATPTEEKAERRWMIEAAARCKDQRVHPNPHMSLGIDWCTTTTQTTASDVKSAEVFQ